MADRAGPPEDRQRRVVRGHLLVRLADDRGPDLQRLTVTFGRLKMRPARKLHDKIPYADALMNKADWTTGLAAAAGIAGSALMMVGGCGGRDPGRCETYGGGNLQSRRRDAKTTDDSTFDALIAAEIRQVSPVAAAIGAWFNARGGKPTFPEECWRLRLSRPIVVSSGKMPCALGADGVNWRFERRSGIDHHGQSRARSVPSSSATRRSWAP